MDKWGLTTYRDSKEGLPDVDHVRIGEITEHSDCHIAYVDGHGFEKNLANATLIIEAVNACISINSHNPLAVAKEIGEMYRIIQYLSRIGWNSGVSWDATDIIYRIQSKEQEA